MDLIVDGAVPLAHCLFEPLQVKQNLQCVDIQNAAALSALITP